MNREKLNFMKEKWIDGECRHICKLCRYRKQCFIENYFEFMNKPIQKGRSFMESTLQRLDKIKMYQEKINKLKQENNILHGVIRELNMEIEEAEKTCYKYQIEIEKMKNTEGVVKELEDLRSELNRERMKKFTGKGVNW